MSVVLPSLRTVRACGSPEEGRSETPLLVISYHASLAPGEEAEAEAEAEAPSLQITFRSGRIIATIATRQSTQGGREGIVCRSGIGQVQHAGT